MDANGYRLSENVEDYRNSNFPGALGWLGIPRPQDVWATAQSVYQHPFEQTTGMPIPPPAPPGSLADQAGSNQLDQMIKALQGQK